MKKFKGILLVLLAVMMLVPGFCRADRYRVLDAALSMLEEGNPFLVHYNEDTGADIKARYPLGCPYFWGGRHESRILHIASPEQASDYYKTDRQYLYGFDCAGFTRWVMAQAGYAEHDSISNLLDFNKYKEFVNYPASKVTGDDRTTELRIGDLVAILHPDGGHHIAMYIGTLLDYGYTRHNLPAELVPYLYYPLLIHCTGSSDYYERYRTYLEENGMDNVLPPFGGVVVTLLDAPASDAPYRTPAVEGLESEPCFDLEGYHLQVTSLENERRIRWIRWKQK